MKSITALFIIATAMLLSAAEALAQSNTFTYQGQIAVQSGTPASFNTAVFTLYTAVTGGSWVNPPETNMISVDSNGVFTALLNFPSGIVFSNPPYYLEIDLATNPAGPFTTLTPRQLLTPTPNSTYAFSAGTAATVGGVSAANIASAVTLANSATISNLPNSIVVRDPSNSITVGSATLTGTLNLPDPAVIYAGPNAFVIEEGSLYVGKNGGSPTINNNDTLHNTGFGDYALFNQASTASGGTYNTAVGDSALYNNTAGFDNTAVGYQALYFNSNGVQNTAVGYGALTGNTSGEYNTAVGNAAMPHNTGGGANTALGFQALWENTTGSDNIAVGYQAGLNIIAGSYNIDIGNFGVSGDADTIRIGVQGTQTSAYISGIYGTSVAANSPFVVVNSGGQLGTATTIPLADLPQIPNSQLQYNSINLSYGSGLSGSGSVSLGGSLTLNNTGVTSLTSGGGVGVNQGSGAVTLSSSPITLSYGSGLGGSSSVSLGGTLSLSLGTIPSSSLSGTYSSAVTLNNASDVYYGNGANLTGVNATELSGLAYNQLPYWSLTGNGGTSPGTDFIGTTDNNRLELHVNGTRALVLYPDPTGNSSANLLGGYIQNAISGAVSGDVIAGGGYGGNANVISNASWSVIGGGGGNTVFPFSTNAVIGGGANNSVFSPFAAIGGGYLNSISGSYAHIGGGYDNAANGSYAAVPGGYENVASGTYSFAAGQQAQALNQGSFVWADSQSGAFASTANNQFLIRAAGYVGIDTNSPLAPLHVVGSREGDSSHPIVMIENLDTTTSSSSALRLVAHGGPSQGVLSVSSSEAGTSPSTNKVTTLLAQFGNSSAYVSELDNNGNWTATSFTGVIFNQSSDRNLKENFDAVSPREVLDRVDSLPISRWNYKTDKNAEHLGPMAQDFHEAFGLNGGDNTHISTVDEGGVALAAIQGLNQKLENQIKEKNTQIQSLQERLERLERILANPTNQHSQAAK